MLAWSSISFVSTTAFCVGSSTASSRRKTHIGRMTSGYFPRLKRSRRTSSAIPQRKETILLWVAWSMLALRPINRAIQETIVRPIGGSSENSGRTRSSDGVLPVEVVFRFVSES